MGKLTRRSLGLGEGFTSDQSKHQLIQKLGAIEHRAEDVLSGMCDYGCRFPLEADEDELSGICEECPMTKLLRMIE